MAPVSGARREAILVEGFPALFHLELPEEALGALGRVDVQDDGRFVPDEHDRHFGVEDPPA